MDRSSLVITDDFLRECRTGWLLVEDNFGGRLNEKEKLKYGKHLGNIQYMHACGIIYY